MKSTINNMQKNLNRLFVILFILILTLSLSSVESTLQSGSISAQPNFEQIRIYHLNVSTHQNNISSSYHGYLELRLTSTDSQLCQGNLTWYLTWDNGISWTSYSVEYTYSENRSYQFAGLLLYTGWWIPPILHLGDEIRIDGDPPSTNNFLRTTPFTVTDLVSIQIHSEYFLCWQLSYGFSQQQHEAFYYEFHTGILVSAISILFEENQPAHEVYVELASISPAIPVLHPLLHYWTSYYSLILALVGASITTLMVNYLLRHLTKSLKKP